MLSSFVPLEVGGCKQFTSCKRSGEPIRQARELLEGFNWNIPFKCRRLKPWIDFFPENIRSVEKQADSYFWGGGCSGKSRGTPEAWSQPLPFARPPSSWPLPQTGFPCWLPAVEPESQEWFYSLNAYIRNCFIPRQYPPNFLLNLTFWITTLNSVKIIYPMVYGG